MMNKYSEIRRIRELLTAGKATIGGWMQLGSPAVAEIMGGGGFDWVAVDLEHGSIGAHQLPNIFRALELGGTLPLVRLAQQNANDCKQALDAGAGGVIVPMVESAGQIVLMREASSWPPSGTRGVAYSRANLYGKNFEEYKLIAQNPLIVAMVETEMGVNNLKEILEVGRPDAILVGPYDLSASLGVIGNFDNIIFKSAIKKIESFCVTARVPLGFHIVNPDKSVLEEKLNEGYQFIAFSMDSVFLELHAKNPHGK